MCICDIYDFFAPYTNVLTYLLTYHYNGAQGHEQFLHVGHLDRALILLDLALCLPSASVHSVFMVVYYIYLKKMMLYIYYEIVHKVHNKKKMKKDKEKIKTQNKNI